MKQRTGHKLIAIVVILPILFFLSCAKKQNWPQFRGPDGNIIVASANLPEKWSNDTNVIWKIPLDGTGFSSPVVWGDRVFITSAFPVKVNPMPERGPMQGPPPGGGQGPQGGQGLQPGQGMPQPGQGPQGARGPQPGLAEPPPQDIPDTSFKKEVYKWEIKCYDLKTGKELWKRVPYTGAPKTGKNPMSTYACETPVTDGERVFAYFGMHGLYCYDMEGKPIWQKDMGAFYTQKGWGTGSSPVLLNGTLFIQFDNEENSYIVAIDAATGNEKWKVHRDEKTTYSTPYIWKNKIRTELVTCGKTARSYDPESGKILWEMKMEGDMSIPSPVGNEELLFIGNAAGRDTKPKLYAVKAGIDGEITNSGTAWISEESGLGNPTPLLYKDRLYIIGGRGEIAVLDAVTGSLKYQKRINGIGSVWATPMGK